MRKTIDKVQLRDNLSIRIEKRRDKENEKPYYIIFLDSSRHSNIYINSNFDLDVLTEQYLEIIKAIGK